MRWLIESRTITTAATKTTVTLLLIMLLLHIKSFVDAQTASPQIPTCCELNLMDETRQVAIETERSLPPGTYSALIARLCTTDTIYIQLWTQVNPSTFTLKWQMPLTPSTIYTEIEYNTISLGNNPVTVTSADRFGFYNPANSTLLKNPIPYDVNPQSGALFFTTQRYSDAQFVTGLQVTVDTTTLWPRTFAAYIAFCPSTSSCSASLLAASTFGQNQGPPGPPGPAGQCCSTAASSCDPGNVIQQNVQSQSNQLATLTATVNNLNTMLNNLINSNSVITGTCPTNFVMGVYGVGSCYIVVKGQTMQMLEAGIVCQNTYNAGLLKINSDKTQNFWMAGMYDTPSRNWYWYSDSQSTKQPMAYGNWKGGNEPAPVGINDICSVYTVDGTQPSGVTDYWQKWDCTKSNNFICEVPKSCM